MDTAKLLENVKIIMAAMMELNPSLKIPIDVLEQELVADAYHEACTEVLQESNSSTDNEPFGFFES